MLTIFSLANPNIVYTIIVYAFYVGVLIMLMTAAFFYPRYRWSLVLIATGGLANILEYAIFRTVNDFIKLPFWPAFNLADILIVLGAVGLFWQIFRKHR